MPLPLPAAARRGALVALVLAAAILTPGRARAQAGTVTVLGFVTDTAAALIPAAEVLVEGAAGQAVRTDAGGAFQLTGLRPGSLVITVRRLGFRARSDRYRTSANDTLQLVLDLVPVPAELEQVTVTERRAVPRARWLDEFESRRGSGFGAFLTRADIERRGPSRTSDLFRTVSGVTVQNGRAGGELRMARSRNCAPDIYIDGLEVKGFRIDDIPPVDIAGIEIFRGPSEVPPRFRRAFAGCGVVSIWTREPGGELAPAGR